MRYSECPTAVNEGKIGLVKAGQLYPELMRCCFSYQNGGLAKSYAARWGFICCGEKIHAAAPIPLNEAVPKIINAQLQHAKKIYKNSG